MKGTYQFLVFRDHLFGHPERIAHTLFPAETNDKNIFLFHPEEKTVQRLYISL